VSTKDGGQRAALGTLDFTLLVVGAIVGADIYIVAAMGSAQLGPAQLVAWLAAGILAAIIGLAFVQCATIKPEVGGTYAYARDAFGSLVGFLAGLALYLGEWVALPVFPLAFAQYLAVFLPDVSPTILRILAAALVIAITTVNILGVRLGARVNDVLTIAKLVPLGLLVLVGFVFTGVHPNDAAAHVSPFVPSGWGGFGAAVVVIFWAYAGFELAVLPASEVTRPRLTLPRGLVFGMAIATAFYLLTSAAVVVAMPSDESARSSRPLADAMSALFAGLGWPREIGSALMTIGALVSIAGVYNVFTLGVARLSWAMARDGLFPRPFARLSRSGTPWVGLLFQALCAVPGVLLLDLRLLIQFAVFFLGLCYVATALAAIRLISHAPNKRVHVPALRVLLGLAALSGLYLSTQAPLPVIAGGVVLLVVGLGVFLRRRGAWQEAASLGADLKREERALVRVTAQRERWLAAALRRAAE
jgi:amino acid transporter